MPFEQVAAAMQMQAEILRRIDERQDRMESAADDGKRSEMMISSTRALNESFRGMRRVQEKLLEELNQDGSGQRRSRWLVFAGLLLLAGGICWGLWLLKGAVEDTGEKLGAQGGTDTLTTQLDSLKDELSRRMARMEEGDRQRLERDLTARIEGLSKAIDGLRSERDGATTRAEQAGRELEQLRTETQAWKERVLAAEREAQRLTTENLSNQKLIASLSASLGAQAAVPEKVPAGSDPGGQGAPGEAADPPAVPTSGSGKDSTPLTPGRRETLNRLLEAHRGSETFHLRSVGSVDKQALKDVVLEVRSRDGGLTREVTAERLGFEVAARGDFLEMVFDKGSVTYHRGSGRAIKSPFFKNVYKVGVFGIDRKSWLAAGFPFVKIK